MRRNNYLNDMKTERFTTILSSLLLFATTVFAGPIDPEKATEIASGFWNRTAKAPNGILKLVPRSNMAKAGGRLQTKEQTPGFYIFTPENEKGFVIVSGDDELPAVIGYSTTAKAGEMPPALCDLLNVYDMYVEDVRNGVVKPVKPATTTTNSNIEPMLTTTWNQNAPYNLMCPQINGSYAPTGCTATAIAQIMKFHNWPDKPSKSFTWYNNTTGKDEYVNTSSHKYDWANMIDSYKSGYTTSEANAVALLMSDVGKAMNSNYALAGTGANPPSAAQVLVNIFKYSPDIVVANREEYTNEEYMELIRTNLEARQPLMYAGYGQNYSAGHAFVCDGINENNLLHINWGWGGMYDGYFDITTMAPGGAGIGGGEERYNVGQAIIANIRPRAIDETGVNGKPTLYSAFVLNPDTDPQKNEEYEVVEKSTKGFANNTSKQRIAFALLNWSHSTTKMQIAMVFEKNGDVYRSEQLNEANDLIELKMNEDSGGHYIIDLTISDIIGDESYFEQGTYNLRLYYSDGGEDSDFELIRGAENNFVLEVTDKETCAYVMKPEITVTELKFHSTPTTKGDPISFDAKFENRNERNSLVVIAPILNRKISDNTYKSDTLTKAAAMITVYDNQEITASFKNVGTFPEDGTYNISFAYNVLNSYTGRATELDRNSALSIDGKSQDIIISPLPDGLVLSTTALSAPAITYGDKASITATVTNISTTNSTFCGTLGLFAKDNTTGRAHLLGTKYVDALEKDASTEIEYNTPDYLPVMQPGEYTITVQQVKEGKWETIRQSAATCIQTIAKTSSPIPYITEIIGINNGKDVIVQGESFEVKATFSSLNADFDGYVRVNIPYGLGYHARSEYVQVSVEKDGTTDVTLNCTTKKTTPLNKYRLNIMYYDSNKKKLGDMSNNTLTYSGNGYFWIGDDTAIEEIECAGDATISVCENYITISNAGDALVTVYSTNGSEIYSGADNTIPVAKGLYIVTVQHNGKATATKVLVK